MIEIINKVPVINSFDYFYFYELKRNLYYT
jgi:hypothetical protein